MSESSKKFWVYRDFKQTASTAALRTVTHEEFNASVQQLCSVYGKVIIVSVARAAKPSNVFVKKQPTSFQPSSWPTDAFISYEL